MQAGRGANDWRMHLAEAEALLGMRSAMMHFVSGNTLRDKREYDKAMEEYEQALRFDPDSPWIYANRGYAWHGKGDHARALVEIDQALKLDPKLGWAYALRASV